MSSRLKLATMAALAMSAFAAIFSSDASFALGSATATNDRVADTIGSLSDGATKRSVTFAAPSEVVQQLSNSASASQTEAPLANPQQASSLAALVSMQGEPETLSDEMQCLAGAVYFESKGETLAGQLAVARVIINRRDSGRFADSLCGVIYQPSQFSFVRHRSMPAINVNGESWREAVAIAQIAMDDSWDSAAEGALFFHARRVSPGWGKPKLAAIDNHIFYR